MSRNEMTWVVLAAALAALPACGQSREEAACNDVVDTFADALERCGQTGGLSRGELEAQLEDSATMGQGCHRVAELRDEELLRDVCLPQLAAIDCAALSAGTIPEACRAQLLVRTP